MSRLIEIENEGERIKFEVAVDKLTAKSTSTLTINDRIQDSIQSSPKDGIFGCKLKVQGKLADGSSVLVQISAHFFRRPLYTFSVNNEIVFQKKGTWGGA